ncbi:MAG TPA: hypothetical protein VFL82_11100 [Thermomicrobiales bacterium]|nr:hypothetical protein [Thermomicrobiales bacterium]
MARGRFAPQAPVYTFRVRILGGFYAPPNGPEITRDIEVAANQTLADLGQAIPDAYDFNDPHLWSFFLSGKPWDDATAYPLVDDSGGMFDVTPAGKATQTLIRDVPYPGRKGDKEFLFLFDFGDEWHFGVRMLGTNDEPIPGVSYPRVVARQGEAPPQYPDVDDDDWDDEEDDEAE